jgi:hypothetical protein
MLMNPRGTIAACPTNSAHWSMPVSMRPGCSLRRHLTAGLCAESTFERARASRRSRFAREPPPRSPTCATPSRRMGLQAPSIAPSPSGATTSPDTRRAAVRQRGSPMPRVVWRRSTNCDRKWPRSSGSAAAGTRAAWHCQTAMSAGPSRAHELTSACPILGHLSRPGANPDDREWLNCAVPASDDQDPGVS